MSGTSAGARHLIAIGIGAGDPRHLTLEAVDAIGRTDVFFLPDKGKRTERLLQVRAGILREHAADSARTVAMPDPPRDRTTAGTDEYRAQVDDWRRRRAEQWARVVHEELAPGETGAFLVWGDPALYDSTLDVVAEIRAAVDFTCEVVPGISSVSALAAHHGTTWTRVGRPVRITTGRPGVDRPDLREDTLVMLDVPGAIAARRGGGWWIHWGAYVGTPDELSVAGPLDEVADRIAELRAEARDRHGWIMDSCLLRPPA